MHTAAQTDLRALRAESASIEDTIAGLGFDQTKLPSVGSLEQASENSIEGLHQKFKEETNPLKRGQLAQQIINLCDAK